MAKLGFDHCEILPLSSDLDFCKDITSVIGDLLKISHWYDDGNIVKQVRPMDRWTDWQQYPLVPMAVEGYKIVQKTKKIIILLSISLVVGHSHNFQISANFLPLFTDIC